MNFISYILVLISWMPLPLVILFCVVGVITGIMLVARIWKFVLSLIPFA